MSQEKPKADRKEMKRDREQDELRRDVVQSLLDNVPFLPTRVSGLKKTCRICGRLRSVQRFARDVAEIDGRDNTCKECLTGMRRVKYLRRKQKDR